jgi:serine/threonine protein kinase
MGRVWVAEQIALERRVAVKVLTEEIIQTTEGRDLFQREARSTARVDHPHVIRVLDFDVTDEGVPFLVLELLVGETLEQHVVERGVLSIEETRELLAQTCDALGFAHECGILHRDIKASNLFLQRRPRAHGIDVKLLDFGIALRKLAPGVRPSAIAGTPEYMSPEHLNGDEIDERCDLFSLGVATYYALSGQFPFPGESAGEVAFAHARGTFTPITKLRPDLPDGIDAWFARALAMERGPRFANAVAMLDAFEDALSEHDAPHAAVAVSAPPAPSRSGLGWAKAGALCAVVAVVLFARFAHSGRPLAHAEATPSPIVTQPLPELPAAAVIVTATAFAPPEPIPHVDTPAFVVVSATSAPKPPPLRAKPKPKAAECDAGIDPYDLVIAGTEGFGNRQ